MPERFPTHLLASSMTMSTEAETVELAPTLNTPEPTQTAPEVVTPDVEAAKPDDEQKAEPSKEDDAEKARRAMQRRIDKRTADLYRERAEKEQLSQRLAALEARANGEPEQPPQQVDPYEVAKEIARVERVTEKANGIAQDGEQRFKAEFRTALETVVEEAGQLFDKKGLPTHLGEAILESDDAAALLHHLGTNPDLAAELNGLSPAQLGRRIERIEAQMKAKPQPKPVSKAPEPARPISASRSSGSLADLSMDEYIATRRAQGAKY